MEREFVTVDVFTEKRFGGNPLAVVFEGRGLTPVQMQAIAAEFNLSETTFVLPPRDPTHTAEVRIFTPKAELPFAGHPNVGTAFALAGRAQGIEEQVLFEEKAGLVRVELMRRGGATVGARIEAPRQPLRGSEVAIEAVAEACAITAADIETRHHPPCVASCGMPFVLAELKTLEALAAASPRVEAFTRALPVEDATGIHLYVRNRTEDVDVRARMFAPLLGVPEDPATGSANLALAGLLASLAPEPDLALTLRIAQGVEMGRPSLLEALAEKREGQVGPVRIGGRCVKVMRGWIDI